jgi:hypothetical protein
MPTLNDVESDPSFVKQRAGCCGFAAVLMALLVRKSSVVDDLVDCATKGQQFKSISKSTRVQGRLLKRLKTGIISGKDDFDHQLCLALMLLFKELCKQESYSGWQECIDYSKLWSWNYAEINYEKAEQSLLQWLTCDWFGAPTTTTMTVSKLQDVPLGAKATFKDLSYKKGDLAIPAVSFPDVLTMVGLSVAKASRLVDDSTFAGFDRKAASVARSTLNKFHGELNGVQKNGSTGSLGYSDVILGVGNNFTGKFNSYYNVTHWVYLPAVPKNTPSSDELQCWTWGAEHDLWGARLNGYYPAYAIYLE